MIKVPYSLVNQLIRFDSLRNKASNGQKPPTSPVITIARDPGSGGRPIAQLVSKKLGYNFYDEKLIESIAKSAKRRKSVVSSVDEKSRSAIQDLIHNLFNPEYLSDTTYIKHLTSVILSIAYTGKVVILGRGSNLIVPKQHSLNVLITAPKNIRVSRAIQYEKLSRKKATQRVETITKDRRDFVSQYFGKSYTNPNYYDLIINTSYFDIDHASDLVISAFRKKFPTLKEKIKKTLKKTGKLY